jgi:hypothetical protein
MPRLSELHQHLAWDVRQTWLLSAGGHEEKAQNQGDDAKGTFHFEGFRELRNDAVNGFCGGKNRCSSLQRR